MKFVSFNKFKEHLFGFGYVEENRKDVYENFGFTTYWFIKPNSKDNFRFRVNVWNNSDRVLNIFYGSNDLNCEEYKIDMRKKFWKNLSI